MQQTVLAHKCMHLSDLRRDHFGQVLDMLQVLKALLPQLSVRVDLSIALQVTHEVILRLDVRQVQ